MLSVSPVHPSSRLQMAIYLHFLTTLNAPVSLPTCVTIYLSPVSGKSSVCTLLGELADDFKKAPNQLFLFLAKLAKAKPIAFGPLYIDRRIKPLRVWVV